MKVKIEANVPLAPLTTLGIGGPAEYFARCTDEEDIAQAESWAAERDLPVFVLGGGSNLLISDSGLRGLTIQPALRGTSFAGQGASVSAAVAAGESWDDFVSACVQRNLAGVECLSGIPGCAGGTPIQNVGAYGQEVAETIRLVRAFDRIQRHWVELTREQCGFSYRASIFNGVARDRYIVGRIEYVLRPGGAATLRYPELRSRLGEDAASLQRVRQVVREIRRSKGMLLDPSDPECHTAGSFFKNPVVEQAGYERIARAAGEAPPCFAVAAALQGPAVAAGENQFKVPAAWLIERAGLRKGYRPLTSTGAPGPVGISSRHTLALVNHGGATAADVLRLQREIQDCVQQRFGIRLAVEPVRVGFTAREME
jgi:UDP-N-acetylmuramate dehydrogenase